MGGNGWEWVVGMGGNGREWVGIGGNGWEWVVGMGGGNGWEWVYRRSPGLDQSGPACPAPPCSKVMLMHAEMHGPAISGRNGLEWVGMGVGNGREWERKVGNGWKWVGLGGGNGWE